MHFLHVLIASLGKETYTNSICIHAYPHIKCKVWVNIAFSWVKVKIQDGRLMHRAGSAFFFSVRVQDSLGMIQQRNLFLQFVPWGDLFRLDYVVKNKIKLQGKLKTLWAINPTNAIQLKPISTPSQPYSTPIQPNSTRPWSTLQPHPTLLNPNPTLLNPTTTLFNLNQPYSTPTLPDPIPTFLNPTKPKPSLTQPFSTLLNPTPCPSLPHPLLNLPARKWPLF